MFVAAGPTPCQRVSSIYVFSQNWHGSFEFGWLIGYSHCTHDTYAKPHLFYWAVYAGDATTHCGVWGSPYLPSPSTFQTFQVSDTNANTYWGALYNGTSLHPNGVNMDFSRGWSVGGMERGSSIDSGFAQWNSLMDYHDANGWTAWDNARSYSDTDPDYHSARSSGSSGAVVHD